MSGGCCTWIFSFLRVGIRGGGFGLFWGSFEFCYTFDVCYLKFTFNPQTDSPSLSRTPQHPLHPGLYPPPPTHIHGVSAHELLVIDNLEVVEAFFEGIREVLCGSRHVCGW